MFDYLQDDFFKYGLKIIKNQTYFFEFEGKIEFIECFDENVDKFN